MSLISYMCGNRHYLHHIQFKFVWRCACERPVFWATVARLIFLIYFQQKLNASETWNMSHLMSHCLAGPCFYRKISCLLFFRGEKRVCVAIVKLLSNGGNVACFTPFSCLLSRLQVFSLLYFSHLWRNVGLARVELLVCLFSIKQVSILILGTG